MNLHVFNVWTDSHLEYLVRRLCFQKFCFAHHEIECDLVCICKKPPFTIQYVCMFKTTISLNIFFLVFSNLVKVNTFTFKLNLFFPARTHSFINQQ